MYSSMGVLCGKKFCDRESICNKNYATEIFQSALETMDIVYSLQNFYATTYTFGVFFI